MDHIFSQLGRVVQSIVVRIVENELNQFAWIPGIIFPLGWTALMQQCSFTIKALQITAFRSALVDK